MSEQSRRKLAAAFEQALDKDRVTRTEERRKDDEEFVRRTDRLQQLAESRPADEQRADTTPDAP